MAGANRVLTLRLATRLNLAKFVPADDRDEKLFRAAEVGDVDAVQAAIRAGGNVLMTKTSQVGGTKPRPWVGPCARGQRWWQVHDLWLE